MRAPARLFVGRDQGRLHTLRRILRDALAHRSLVLRAVGAQIVQIALSLSLPLVLKEAIDRGLAARDYNVLILAAVATVAVTLVRAVIWYTVTYSYQSLGTTTAREYRDRVYEKLQRSSFAFHTRAQSGDLFAHGSIDVQAVEQLLNSGLREVVNLTLLCGLLFVMLLRVDASLTLIALPMLPALALLALYYSPRSRERSRRVQHQYGQLTARLQENLTGMRVVKSFAAGQREIEHFDNHLNELYDASLSLGKLNALVFPTMTFVTAVGIGAVLWVGGERVVSGELTLGSLVAFITYLTMLVAPVRMLGTTINLVVEAVAGAERVHRVLDSADVIEIPEQAEQKLALPPIDGAIRFEGVTFGYRSGEPILTDISFEVAPGETLGVVGRTGAGKSTLALLLGRFYDPQLGTVQIDGFDAREVQLASLRRQIGYVFQEPFLFSASIADNIALGRSDATREEIVDAAKTACLHDFIVSLPDGYETELGERGITLSGGQRQRLALARALLVDPRILVLDDTTSALDPITAGEVWRRVKGRLRLPDGRMRNQTTIVIAQRLAAVRDADQIIVVDGGRICERGRHEELLARNGLYVRLWRQQEEQAGDAIDHEQLREQPAGGGSVAVSEDRPPELVANGHGGQVAAIGDGKPKDQKVDVLALSEDDSVLGKAYDHLLMNRLLGYLAPFRLLMVLTVITMLIHSGASLSGPYVLQKVAIDNAIAIGDVVALRQFALLFIGVGLVQYLAGMAYTYYLARAAYEMLRGVRRSIFVHLQALSLSFYDRYKVGRLMSIMTGDVGAISNMLSTGLVAMVGDLFVLIGVIGVLLSMHAPLALISFLSIPLVALISHRLRQQARFHYRDVRRASSIANGSLAEGIAGVRVTQAYCREEINRSRFGSLLAELQDHTLRAAKVMARFGPTMDTINSFVQALIFTYGGWLVLQGDLTTGALVAFLAYANRFFEPIRDLSMRYNTLQAAMAGSERIFALLDTPATVTDRPHAHPLPRLQGEVTFDQVQFSYTPDRKVLSDLNLTIRPGEQVAIVGPTGAGKTSIISLVMRFYDTIGGEIRIDGIPIQSVTTSSLRQQVGVVLQDPFLFSGTIADNLRFSRPDARQEDLETACRAVGLHDWITAQPGGYSTFLAERGANLSAGQKQLLSFARALLNDPRILILDEATANVDTETEAQIQEALRVLLRGRTAIIIAHRLSTVRAADRIVVLEAGRIVEIGSHHELLRAGGHYARLHRAVGQPVG